MNLYSQEYGVGQPLVILHGLLGSLDNWHTLSKVFSTSFHVLAVDQRNHGRSPHSSSFTYDAMANDLQELLDEKSITTAHLLGHSMGGKTAMQFALSFPERVKKLIVVDIAPRVYPRLHDEIFQALMSIDLSELESRGQVDIELAKKIPDVTMRQFLMKNLARDDSGKLVWKANLEALNESYAEIAREIHSIRPFVNPALFVKSNRSGYVMDADIPGIKRLFPNAQIAGVDAGHWIHAEEPARFSEIVLKFLGGSQS
jgi:esterase